MLGFRRFLFIFFIISLSLNVFSQNPDEKTNSIREKEISLLEEIIEDADKLKLPENRALVYARVGNQIWDIDNKYARDLFQKSIDDLIVAQNEAELEKTVNSFLNNLIYGQYPRGAILNFIAARDVQMALDALIKSRPAKVEQLLMNGENRSNAISRYSNFSHYKQNEIQTEQRFLSLLAKQNPKNSIKLFRENIQRGITYETLNMLYQIHQKNPLAAKSLTSEIVQKLKTLKLSKNNQNFGIIQNFIERFALPPTNNDDKQLRVSDGQISGLIDKLSGEWQKPVYQSFNVNSNTFKAIERMYPGRALIFKERVEKQKIRTADQNPEYQQYLDLIKSKLPPAEILKKAKNNSQYRNSIVEHVIRQISQNGDIKEIETILNNEFHEAERDQRKTRFFTNRANLEISKGNYDEAQLLINEIPDEQQRIFPLVQLANSVYQKNPEENRQQAAGILGQINLFLDEKPDTQQKISTLLFLAGAYSAIEPGEGFRLMESIIDPLNEFAKAYAVVSGFRNEGRTRKGEYLIFTGVDATGQFNLGFIFQKLKTSDFEKTVQLINRFEQLETRLAFKLQMINTFSNFQIVNLPINRITSFKSSRS
jgi:hypothetical protein